MTPQNPKINVSKQNKNIFYMRNCGCQVQTVPLKKGEKSRIKLEYEWGSKSLASEPQFPFSSVF